MLSKNCGRQEERNAYFLLAHLLLQVSVGTVGASAANSDARSMKQPPSDPGGIVGRTIATRPGILSLPTTLREHVRPLAR